MKSRPLFNVLRWLIPLAVVVMMFSVVQHVGAQSPQPPDLTQVAAKTDDTTTSVNVLWTLVAVYWCSLCRRASHWWRRALPAIKTWLTP
jgi:hypothetical protein